LLNIRNSEKGRMKTVLLSLAVCGAVVLLSSFTDALQISLGLGHGKDNGKNTGVNTGCSAKGPPFSELDFVYKDYGRFWARKVKTFFRQLAGGKTGTCTKQSYLTLGQRIVDFEKLNELQTKQLLLKFGTIFDAFFGEFAVNGGVDEATFVYAVRHNQFYLRDAAGAFYGLWFDLMDGDGDGSISSEDFKLFNRMFTIDESLAADSFKTLDADHDGNILQGEFVNIGNQFWLTEDEKLTVNGLHGPLAE